MKILASNAHKRWIRFGLASHKGLNLFSEFSNKIFTTNKSLVIRNKQCSLVVLDGINLIGKNHTFYKDILESNLHDEIFIVGDAILNNTYFNQFKNIKLLFYQDFRDNKDVLQKFKNINIYNRFRYNILPGFFYFAKDFINNPVFVSDLIKMPKTILFAGQTGKHSIISLFLNHITEDYEKEKVSFEHYVDNCFKRCDNQIKSNNSIDNLCNLIIETNKEIKLKLDKTELAKLQPSFEFERDTVIFKSVLRFVLITHLKYLNLLNVIPYPGFYVRLYHSKFYRKHMFVDFGGVNGYETLYPRTADMVFNQLNFYQFNQQDMKLCQKDLNFNVLSEFLNQELFKLKMSYGN